MTTENTANSETHVPGVWLSALFCVALLVRLIHLGTTDLGVTEIAYLKLSQPSLIPIDSLRECYHQFLINGQMPAVAMVQSVMRWLLLPLSGHDASNFWLRLPSALWSALAVIPLMQLGSLLAGRTVGIMTGLIAALFFFPVFYGREMADYAGLVLFSILALHGWFSIAAAGAAPVRLRDKVFTTLALGATSVAHITGVLIPLALVALGLTWAVRPPKALPRAAIWNLVLIALLGSLTSVPFFWKWLMHGNATATASPLTIPGILHDGIGKQFFGVHLPPFLFACVLLLSGVVACIRWKDNRRHLRVGLLAVLIVLSAIITLAGQSLGYAARSFSVINGLLYLTAAVGIFHTFRTLNTHGGIAAVGMTVLMVIASGVVFFPALYALPAKGVNYGGIARTLVATLPPGTPYVMESGYDLRFTPGRFPTPGLLAACPYLHGDVKELWARQQRFFERFPTAAYVESAHHGSGPLETTGIFEWPRQHFRQKIELTNPKFDRLVDLGIWPESVDTAAPNIQSSTAIYFNTPADNDAIATAVGEKAVPEFSGWKIREIEQFKYAYVSTNLIATINIRNLTPDYISGDLEIPLALMAPPSTSYQIDVLQDGMVVGTLPHKGGVFNTLKTGVMRYKPGDNAITLRVSQGDLSKFKAIVVPGAEFQSQ